MIYEFRAPEGDTAERLIELSALWRDEGCSWGIVANTREDLCEPLAVALDGGTIVGYIFGRYYTAEKHTATIEPGTRCFSVEELYVLPAWRGQGVGRALFRMMEAAVRDQCAYITLATSTRDYRAILHFYAEELGMDFHSAFLFKRMDAPAVKGAMKRVLVIGCPGSGKSTFARALHGATGLPLYHLDLLYWNADRTTVDKAVFRARLAEIMERDEWIIDGNYNSTMEVRFQACDTVFFLDYPADVCLDGIAARQGQPRAGMPWTEQPGERDEAFIDFIRNYRRDSRPKVLELMRRYADRRVVTFESRAAADEYLRGLARPD